MIVHGVRVTAGSVLPETVRLEAHVRFETPDGGREAEDDLLWFELPARVADDPAASGTPWLLALLPLAMARGERLLIPLPVDPRLFRQAEEIMRLWHCWYPHLREVPLETDGFDTRPAPGAQRRLSFFTGGVDAFFTLLHHDTTARERRVPIPGEAPIDDLLYVVGLDVMLEHGRSIHRRTRVLRETAAELGKELVLMATNLRGSRLKTLDYGTLWHGVALGACALTLGPRYGEVLLSSSHDYCNAFPWGSHMTLDPLMSTSLTRFVHYGAGFTRVEKTRFLAGHDVALRRLHVCWRGESLVNCGTCSKCLRTMLTLDMVGALPRATTFDATGYSADAARRIEVEGESDVSFIDEVRAAAAACGRTDIEGALADCLARNRRIAQPKAWLARMGRVPGLGRLAESWTKKLLA